MQGKVRELWRFWEKGSMGEESTPTALLLGQACACPQTYLRVPTPRLMSPHRDALSSC